jgi:hypothetical protein
MNKGPKQEKTGNRIRLISGIRDLGCGKRGALRAKMTSKAPAVFDR